MTLFNVLTFDLISECFTIDIIHQMGAPQQGLDLTVFKEGF